MAGFLYFVPGEKGGALRAGLLDELGLSGVVEGCSTSVVQTQGPDKKGGLLFVAGSEHGQDKQEKPKTGYYSEHQEWIAAENGRYWVGLETARPPKPADLIRRETVSGHFCKLGDGQEWLIPAARVFPSGSALPASLVLGPNGELVRESLPRFASLSDRAEKLWKDFTEEAASNDSHDPMSIEDQWQLAVDAIAINYRIDRWGVSALKLISTTCIREVNGAIIDLPTFLSVLREHNESESKKKDVITDDGSQLSDGSAGKSENTTQPSAILN